MRTTLALDDDLVREAQRLTGTQEKSALVRQAPRALIEVCADSWASSRPGGQLLVERDQVAVRVRRGELPIPPWLVGNVCPRMDHTGG